MSNYHLRDCSLSLKAKGLLSLFLSLPDEWHYSISGITKITTKFTTQQKETKIIMASPYVKEHFLFRDKTVMDKEYRSFMNNVCSWTMNGKAKHDDGPDSLAMAADYAQTFIYGRARVFERPF